jgi:hypothetical protein
MLLLPMYPFRSDMTHGIEEFPSNELVEAVYDVSRQCISLVYSYLTMLCGKCGFNSVSPFSENSCP